MIRDLFHDLHTRWVNLNSFFRLLSVLCVLSVLGLITAKPAYHAFKQWRMDRNLAAAQQAVDGMRMQQARDLSLTVLRSGNLNIQAFRIFEQSTAALSDPRHANIARALISHPDGTDADRLTGFLTMTETMPLGIVGQAWMELPEKNRRQPRFATAFAKRMLAEQHIAESAQILLGVPQDARDSNVRQNLARVLIASGKSEGVGEAQRMIAQGLSDPEKGEVPEWLDVLEALPIPEIQENLLSPIRGLSRNVSEENSARVALALARMDYAAALPDATATLDQTVAKWKDSKPELVAQFLIDLKLHRLLLDSYPIDGLHNYPELTPLLLDATYKTEEWNDAMRLLDANIGDMPKYLKLAHLAVVTMKLSDTSSGNELWRAAIAEAKADYKNRALLKLHQVAADAGFDELAASAMLNAVRVGHGPLPLYKDQKNLYRTLLESKQDASLLEVCAIYLSFEPSNPILLTQYAYLACLNDAIEPTRLLPHLKLLAQAFPNEYPIHSTLATVFLFAGQPEQAAAALAPFDVKIQELAPPYRIVYLAAQVLNDVIPDDAPQIESFPWNSLLPSERRKFSSLIHKKN